MNYDSDACSSDIEASDFVLSRAYKRREGMQQ